MAYPDMAEEIVEQLFTEQVENYLTKNLEAMLAHYVSTPELLFWNAEGGMIRDMQRLQSWYNDLFNQFDIQSVRYKVESVYSSSSLIMVGSLWVFNIRTMEGEESFFEEQALRATHALRQHDGCWLIEHLHASNSRYSEDSG